MNVHKNARLTPHGRERIARQVLSGQTPKAVGEAAGVCPRTARKWAARMVSHRRWTAVRKTFTCQSTAFMFPARSRRRSRDGSAGGAFKRPQNCIYTEE